MLQGYTVCSQIVTIISNMLNHTRTPTVLAAIVVLLLVQFPLVDYVTGFVQHVRTVYNAPGREVGETSMKAHYLIMTNGINDVIHTERDVIGKQEVSSSSSCPTDCWCGCVDIIGITWLKLSCENRTTNATSLSQEINAYLTSVNWNLTRLLMEDTPLTVIPESICQLERLTWLVLRGNSFLTRLPDNCFTRLHELQYFAAVDGGLTSLQDGLFDNLTKLQSVYFSFNQISSIDAHLFDVTANLPNLQVIDVSYNNLTEIDTWPVRRAQLISGFNISLSYNRISRFINSLGWHYNCSSAHLPSPNIDLTHNNISHVNNLLRGWNINGLFCCVKACRDGRFVWLREPRLIAYMNVKNCTLYKC